jgi:hypothetical protein
LKKAHVAELVDAADSKSAVRKGVKVRFLSWAPIYKNPPTCRGIFNFDFLLLIVSARMAKLVDALPSGGSVRKDVQVRILFRAPSLLILSEGFFYITVHHSTLSPLQKRI